MNYDSDISFEKKVNIFSFEYLKCILSVVEPGVNDCIFTKKFYSKLITASRILKDFLDFHGAKKNKEWVFYRELSATIMHLSLACYSQIHILDRFNFYRFNDSNHFQEKDHRVFILSAYDTLKIIQDSLKLAFPLIVKEAIALNIKIPEKIYSLDYFPKVPSSYQLNHNIDDFNSKAQQRQNLTMIASEFLEIVRNFEQFAFYEPYDLKRIKELVPERINEVTVRKYEMLVHNLQSSFDSYVVNTKTASENIILEQIRSHFSIVFNILQVMGRLLHFYERHLYDIGFKDVYRNISLKLTEIIYPDILLDRAVNFCFLYAWKFLSSGKELALEILNQNMETSLIEVGIPVERGFHSRPSLLVAKIVQHYGGEVKMHIRKHMFDASSVLDIQWAGGKIKEENITKVSFRGDSRALKDLKILAGVNYGENRKGKKISLPKELFYLA